MHTNLLLYYLVLDLLIASEGSVLPSVRRAQEESIATSELWFAYCKPSNTTCGQHSTAKQ